MPMMYNMLLAMIVDASRDVLVEIRRVRSQFPFGESLRPICFLWSR
jgi:hypothetical protein